MHFQDEHGLLEWELEGTGGKSDSADQLLRSPMSGISAVICTTAEVSARQQLLARLNFLDSMPACESSAGQIYAEDKEDAAPRSADEGRLQSPSRDDAPLQPSSQSAGLQGEGLQAGMTFAKESKLQVNTSNMGH